MLHLAVHLEAPRQEEHLQLEAPAAHIGVEIVEVWVVDDRLIEDFPAELLTQPAREMRLADADVACDADEMRARHAVSPSDASV